MNIINNSVRKSLQLVPFVKAFPSISLLLRRCSRLGIIGVYFLMCSSNTVWILSILRRNMTTRLISICGRRSLFKWMHLADRLSDWNSITDRKLQWLNCKWRKNKCAAEHRTVRAFPELQTSRIIFSCNKSGNAHNFLSFALKSSSNLFLSLRSTKFSLERNFFKQFNRHK